MRAGSITVSLSVFFRLSCVYFCKANDFTLRLTEKISRDKLFDLPNK